MYVNPNCPECNGDGIVQSKPAGAGYADDLAEYLPCPTCRNKAMEDIAIIAAEGRGKSTSGDI